MHNTATCPVRALRPSSRPFTHYFAVDDRGPGVDVPRVIGDLLEPLGPVIAAPREHRDRGVFQVNLHPVAVDDLVEPAPAARHLVNRRRQCRLNEPGYLALMPIAAGFLR